MNSKLIVTFWDQICTDLPLFVNLDKSTPILIVECHQECTRVKHHKKKLVFLIASMRKFKDELTKKGFNVIYHRLKLNDTETNWEDILTKEINKRKVKELHLTEPSEYHLITMLNRVKKTTKVELVMHKDSRFLQSREEFNTWIGEKTNNQIIMESFYRVMRRKTGFLITAENKPEQGNWNFDKENRKRLPKEIKVPERPKLKRDEETEQLIKQVVKLVTTNFKDHFGAAYPFEYAITKKEAKKLLIWFLNIAMTNFGVYQDAMHTDEVFLYHSVIAHYLNVGLLLPEDVCSQVEAKYYANEISIAAAEGFIRQIIGWREFVRGIYWRYMPGYGKLNTLGYKRKLPDFYWHGRTKMNCLANVIANTDKYAYSHHIQRLMITGNFAALAGIRPKDIHEWYLIVYIDAFEWVEMPNTIGMATYADGGIVGTKPYVASGNYINKMSNFCTGCKYKVKEKTGATACPFNYLYWNYLLEHRKILESNQRMKLAYLSLSKMSKENVVAVKASAAKFLQQLDESKEV